MYLDQPTRSRAAGASPGTLFPSPDAHPTNLHWYLYGPHTCEEQHKVPVHSVPDPIPEGSVLWVDVRGLSDTVQLEFLAHRFQIHALALADIVNTPQRPKAEAYQDHTLIICHMLSMGADGEIHVEQISVVHGANFVITVQEREHDGDVLDPVRKRLRQAKGRIRAAGADYLTYAILDAVVDAYFPVLEQISQLLEDLELPVLEHPTRETGKRVYAFKRTLLAVRRSIWPQREAFMVLLREEDGLMTAATRVFLRDVVDHTVQVVDLVETYREFTASLMELYLSSVNNRMNEVVKVLTIISTIFLPLSFIAGVYGMNFDPGTSRWNMPELRWAYGYPLALGMMALVGGGMLVWFRRVGWMGGGGAVVSGRAVTR